MNQMIRLTSFISCFLLTGAGFAPQPAKQELHVFGPDDRLPMTRFDGKYGAIGKLFFPNGSHCTGTLVGPDKVLTAAHCLTGLAELPDRKIVFVPKATMDLDANLAVRELLLSKSPDRAAYGKSWISGDPADTNTSRDENGLLILKDKKIDWAIITLDRPLGKKHGWLRINPLPPESLPGRRVRLIGYSADFQGGVVAGFAPDCQIRDSLDKGGVLGHDCDASPGSSGGALLEDDGQGRLQIIGINIGQTVVPEDQKENLEYGKKIWIRQKNGFPNWRIVYNYGIPASTFLSATQSVDHDF